MCVSDNKKVKEELQKIKKEEKKLDELFDLEKIITGIKKLSFFQKVIMEKLNIKSDLYK